MKVYQSPPTKELNEGGIKRVQQFRCWQENIKNWYFNIKYWLIDFFDNNYQIAKYINENELNCVGVMNDFGLTFDEASELLIMAFNQRKEDKIYEGISITTN